VFIAEQILMEKLYCSSENLPRGHKIREKPNTSCIGLGPLLTRKGGWSRPIAHSGSGRYAEGKPLQLASYEGYYTKVPRFPGYASPASLLRAAQENAYIK
jgi:hypothetical protein